MELNNSKQFNPVNSINRAKLFKKTSINWKLKLEGNEYIWSSKLERVKILRNGIPYESVEVLSKRMNISIKDVLDKFGIAQTTYNKKRREKALLNGRDSEIVLLLTELLDFGQEVFNFEDEKFLRWMKKQNISLGGNTPESLFDSITGIQEVKNCLNRIEFGNLA